MKKLFFIIFGLVSFFQLQAIDLLFESTSEIQKIIAFQYKQKIKICPSMHQCEGFLENSLIKVPSGYEKIQNLKIGDLVYGLGNHEKIIIDIFKQSACKFVRLRKKAEVIDVACYQKFYLPLENRWIVAQDITPLDAVLSMDNKYISFDMVEIIDQDINLYCITVEDHFFKISLQDILVHNIALPIAEVLTFLFVEMRQPVIYLLGSTISLKYLSTYSPFKNINDAIVYEASQEKCAFDYKYAVLKSIKKEFMDIYNALKAINYKFEDQKNLLNYRFIMQKDIPYFLNISAQTEGELNLEARLSLTKYRQESLEVLEENICNLQIKIGLCVDECVYRKDETIKFYNEFRNKGIDQFYKTRTLNSSYSYQMVKKYYEDFMIYEMLIRQIEERVEELSIIVKIFEKCSENSVIALTTTILPVLTIQKKCIEDNNKIIQVTKNDDEVTKNTLRDYFRNYQFLPDVTQAIITVKNLLYNNLKNGIWNRSDDKKYAKVLEPDQEPEDDDREVPRIYVKSEKHPIWRNDRDIDEYVGYKISPAPRNGQVALAQSIEVQSGARIALQDGAIVILLITRYLPVKGSEWHGYVTTYDEMIKKSHMRPFIEILKKSGLMRKNGKLK